jgi:predicted MPP superfamily phosphohydrolase
VIAVLLLLVAVVGHAAIWVASVNRTHATGWPHSVVNKVDKLEFFLLFVPPPAVAIWLFWIPAESLMPWRIGDCSSFRMGENGTVPLVAILAHTLSVYIALCWLVAVIVAVTYLWRIISYDVSAVLRYHRRHRLNTQSVLHSPDHPHHALVHLPGNEALQLDLTERGLDVPRLPAELEGLSIVHLSDLHFTGRIGRPFFEEMARMSNALQPDLVAITGDLVDKGRCIDWIPDTLGRLKARYGVYCIFGNHDLRVDWQRMLRVLDDCGIVYVGGRWQTVEVRGQPLLLAGNELPWFKPAADPRTFPPRSEVPFRIMLAHSPDQLSWARQGDGDLMLAGHTHGGQIRLPFIGPILSPSFKGVQYASGLFYIPPVILNVSRGLSGEVPLRMNCPPEIIHLTLHAGGQQPTAMNEQQSAIGGEALKTAGG